MTNTKRKVISLKTFTKERENLITDSIDRHLIAVDKSLIIIIPILVISSISISFLYSIFLKNQINSLRSTEPKIITELKSNKITLQKELKILEKDNFILRNKLSIGAIKDSAR